MANPNPFEAQLEAAINAYRMAMKTCHYNDGSDMPHELHLQIHTSFVTAIERASGRNSIYFRNATAIRASNEHIELQGIAGVCKSLLSDIRNGYTRTMEELIHADVFADYLEMADHLLATGYKDAAAVIAGSTLEAHLHKLCGKHGLPVEDGGKPKKADTLNADLCKANVYSKLDQKSVTSWMDLRNKAAHGHYAEYNKSQVTLMAAAVRDFIARLPA